MCGIAGFIGVTEGSRGLALGMARALHHRGPDASGVRALPGDQGWFGHARLRILDLDPRADQPMVSRRSGAVLVFNGEIYNWRSLQAELGGGETRSDSEVILQAFDAWGLEGLERLDGMFAFALFDPKERQLVLMRDRMGKKPLYWAQLPSGGLAFGSEAKALFEVPGLRPEPNWDRLPELLTFGYVGTPRSFFRGVERLPPASLLVRSAEGEVGVRTYWTLTRDPEVAALSLRDAATGVRQRVRRAVERRLVSDAPLGAFLSGGIDSTVVVYEMTRAGAEPPATFSAGFRHDASYDETPVAARTAARLGTRHRELMVSGVGPDRLERLLWHHDEPYGDSSALAVDALAAETKPFVDVILTGDGGDELFGGYSRFLGGLLQAAVPGPVGRLAGAGLSRLADRTSYKHPLTLARRFFEHPERSVDERLLAWNAFFAGPAVEKLVRPELLSPSNGWSAMSEQLDVLASARRAGRNRLEQILEHNFRTYLLDDLLVKTDRMTMAHGLEARSPFLDRDLVEFAFSLPSALKIRRGTLKWILREAYRGRIPDEVLKGAKHGFGVPVGEWWRDQARAWVEDLLLDPRARCREVLQGARVERLVEEHRSRFRDHGQRIFLLLNLELWLRGLDR